MSQEYQQEIPSILAKWSDIVKSLYDINTDKQFASWSATLENTNVKDYVRNIVIPTATITVNNLINHLEEARYQKRSTQGKTVLSLEQLKSLYTCVEVIWYLGVQQYVSYFAQYTFRRTPVPKSQKISDKILEILYTQSLYTESQCLDVALTREIITRIECINKVITMEFFRFLMIERNMNRVLITLMTLSKFDTLYSTKNKQVDLQLDSDIAAIKEVSSNRLGNLTECQPFQALIISQMRPFARGPAWLRKCSCNILTSILLNEYNGVKAVLSGYLEDSVDTAMADKLQMQVVKLLTSVPLAMKKESFFKCIAKQIPPLLIDALLANDTDMLKICSMIVNRISILEPKVCEEVILVALFCPLLSGISDFDGKSINLYGEAIEQYSATEKNSIEKDNSIAYAAGHVIVDFATLQATIRMLYSLFTACPATSSLMNCITNAGIATALVELYISAQCKAFNGLSIDLLPIITSSVLMYMQKQRTGVVAVVLNALHREDYDDRRCFHTNNSGEISVVAKQPCNDHYKIQSEFSIDTLINAIKQNEMTAAVESDSHGSINNNEQELMYVAQQRTKAIVQLINLLETNKPKCSDSTSNEESASLLCSNIGSELYLHALAAFLGQSEHSSSQRAITTKRYGGLMLLTIQENVPFEVFLRNGEQVLKLVTTIVEVYGLVEGYASELTESSGIPTELQKVLPSLELADKPKIVELKTEIREPARKSEASESGMVSDDLMVIGVAIQLLSGIVTFGEQKRSPCEEELLIRLLNPLQKIAFTSSSNDNGNSDLAVAAGDLALMLINRVASRSTSTDTSQLLPSESVSDDIFVIESIEKLMEALDSDEYWLSESPVSRAFGLRLLCKWIKSHRDRVMALERCQMEALLVPLLKLLLDSDSFVYLNTLITLRELGGYHTELLFSCLLDIYSGHAKVTGEKDETCNSTKSVRSLSNIELGSLNDKRRSMIGEALMLMLRSQTPSTDSNSGWSPLKSSLPRLITTCIRISRSRPSHEDNSVISTYVDLSKMRIKAPVKELVKPTTAVEEEEEEVSVASQEELKHAGYVGDAIILRQSAVSLLAEAIVAAGDWGPASLSTAMVSDIVDIGEGILCLEYQNSETSRASRRAAAFLISHLAITAPEQLWEHHVTQLKSSGEAPDHYYLQKLDDAQSFIRTTPTLLRRIMAILKKLNSDPDKVVSFHLHNARGSLNNSIKEILQFASKQDSNVPEVLKIVRSKNYLL